MSHYIIFIYIYIYGQGPLHVPLYIDGVAMHGVARMSRMSIDDVEKVCMSWRTLCMESLCRMIVSIRFAILHLVLYASLYPPASVPSSRGREDARTDGRLHGWMDGEACRRTYIVRNS